MPWDIRHESSGEIHEGLERETVRELLSTRQLVVTDWARPAPSWPWHQLATIDDFCDIAHSQRRRRKQETAEDEEEMDMTPMIDVTFLLLVFFMITAAFTLQKGLDFPPEKTDDDQSQNDEPAPGLNQLQLERLVLRVNDQDEFQLLDENQQPGPVIPADSLKETLQQASQEQDKFQLLILPNPNASHEAMVRAINSSALAGITAVSIAEIQSRPADTEIPAP